MRLKKVFYLRDPKMIAWCVGTLDRETSKIEIADGILLSSYTKCICGHTLGGHAPMGRCCQDCKCKWPDVEFPVKELKKFVENAEWDI